MDDEEGKIKFRFSVNIEIEFECGSMQRQCWYLFGPNVNDKKGSACVYILFCFSLFVHPKFHYETKMFNIETAFSGELSAITRCRHGNIWLIIFVLRVHENKRMSAYKKNPLHDT